MSSMLQQRTGAPVNARWASDSKAVRRTVLCRAETEAAAAVKAPTKAAAAAQPSTPAAAAPMAIPEWVPEQAAPVLKFLTATDFKLQDSALYKEKLQPYLANEYVIQSTGFKNLPETINGRAAMLGFLAGAAAEIFGAGPLLLQLSKAPQPVLVVTALIVAGSIIPVVKGTEGGYLASLRDTYTLPEGVFTEEMERLHGRLAMVGVGALVVLELLKGSAVL